MINAIKELCSKCHNCNLGDEMKTSVFGIGNPKSKIMIIGEGSGGNDDLEGIPFAGKAGQLLDKILEAVSIKKEEVYMTNITKCRPLENRIPEKDEIEACREYVEAEIALVKPEIIVALGETASQFFLGKEGEINKVRGHLFKEQGMDLICTFHPVDLLKDPNKKRPVWEDFKKIQKRIEKNSRKR